ncbi:MAG: FAD-dependent oxidoreductase [Erythrobacter sp.]|nr:FAD-dependent oxidoreductase [Erythrobacter sp.]
MSDARLLLIGGGHAHVAVLADWIRRGTPIPTTLITPYPTLRYSGMVPGWIAGEHDRDAGLVDLAGLARRAGVDLVLDRCTGIDGDSGTIATESGSSIRFDFASLDTGGIGRARAILGEDPRVLDVRPIDGFVEKLGNWIAANSSAESHVAIVGGGAGGVELAFGLRNRAGPGPTPSVTLVAGKDGLLPGFSGGVLRHVRSDLAAQGIVLAETDAAIESGRLMAGARSLEPVDLIVAALGSAAPIDPDAIGLACDPEGFVAVDRFQRSVSYPNIFAAGDVAARQDRLVPHSGVHAVHAGPVLAHNLRALAEGSDTLKSYRPRRASLYLLATGNGSAIGSYGPVAFRGRWVGALKRWIDKRWIGTYARLAGGHG